MTISSLTGTSDSNEANQGLKIALISVHGLIRGTDMELGRDADTGGQTTYVVELARALGQLGQVARVDLLTRQIIDDRVSSDYAQIEERLTDVARIVRIPFGPKRYLRKEKLWPFIDIFVDHTLAYFRRSGGPPDVIHGHYADAGYAGAQLARLLAVPFVFTGHSLGRVKRERLLKKEKDPARLEERYSLTRRIEAEEFALETASLVIASTHQEVEEQYSSYQNYIPERMEVIPPGVDLDRFRPPQPSDPSAPIEKSIDRFLDEPAKPVILAMARPDDRKNLEALVNVFGQSSRLQERANLVLILGSRDDIREMQPGQRRVLTNILTLIDTHDLYGKVAYPKSHNATDVPDIYRIAASRGGVFINPAFTEPFGLTLLESAASGLPIIATNDGGPRDIVANCLNGRLIDPFDDESIENALLSALSDKKQWKEWSEAGTSGARGNYTWSRHASRYFREIAELNERFVADRRLVKRRHRRIPDLDRLLITDIDNTLTGDDEAMRDLIQLLDDAEVEVGFGIATGRNFDEAVALINDLEITRPILLITSVGTEIYYGQGFTRDRSWWQHIDFRWNRDDIKNVLDGIDGLFLQDESAQSQYKISYQIDPDIAPRLTGIRKILRENGVRANVVLSLGIYLDVIPARAGSGLSIRHVALTWGIPMERILVAGDSGNDEHMLAGSTLGVVVGNHGPELEKLRTFPRVYFSGQNHARGIIDGINYYNFLDNIRIPNERDET